MTEYCKHGVDMATTCRKCGRIMVVEVPDFAAKKNSFIASIDRLEETVRRMNAELARPPVAPPVPPAAASNQKPTDDDQETAPPPPPIERFPWQRG